MKSPRTPAPTHRLHPPPPHFCRSGVSQSSQGYSLAFGIFQEHYSTHPDLLSPPASQALIASVGTTQTGLLYLLNPILTIALAVWSASASTRPIAVPSSSSPSPLLRRLAAHLRSLPPFGVLSSPARLFLLLGGAISVAALVLASSPLASTPSLLLLAQGVLHALGCAVLFAALVRALDSFWVGRRGFAYGVMWAAKSAAGAGMPFAAKAALVRWGVGPTLRGWAVVTGVVVAACLPFLTVRGTEDDGRDNAAVEEGDFETAAAAAAAPTTTTTTTATTGTAGDTTRQTPTQSLRSRRPRPAATDASRAGPMRRLRARLPPMAFTRRPYFWTLQLGNVAQAVGYLMPPTFLAGYASAALGLPDSSGPLLLALFCLASVPGSLVHGLLADHHDHGGRPPPPAAPPEEQRPGWPHPRRRRISLLPGLSLSPAGVIAMSSLGSSVAVFALWGPSRTEGSSSSSSKNSNAGALGMLAAFALAYGFFAGGFSSTWSGVLREMQSGGGRFGNGTDTVDAAPGDGEGDGAVQQHAVAGSGTEEGTREDAVAGSLDTDSTALVFGLLMGGRGLGFLVSGPLSGALLSMAASSTSSSSSSSSGDGGSHAPRTVVGYATEYGPMIVCTGVTALLGAGGWVWKAGAEATWWRRCGGRCMGVARRCAKRSAECLRARRD